MMTEKWVSKFWEGEAPAEPSLRGARNVRLGRSLALPTLVPLLAATAAYAGPSQEDVFKSIQQNVGRTTSSDSGLVIVLVLVAVGLLILLAVFSQRQKRAIAPKALNHHGKLIKEVSKAIALKPAQLKKLKAVAEDRAEPLESPLTLLLCPSLIKKK